MHTLVLSAEEIIGAKKLYDYLAVIARKKVNTGNIGAINGYWDEYVWFEYNLWKGLGKYINKLC